MSTRRDMFLDERGAGLRVTWHPERDLVVLSVWQGDSCVGTFRMTVQDVPRLTGLLAAALDDWVDQADDVARPVRRRVEARPVGRRDDTDPGANLTANQGVDPATSPGVGPATNPGTNSATNPGTNPTTSPSVKPATNPGTGSGGNPRTRSGADLSVQQRLRLSRPVLRLRGLQHRRRRLA